MECFAVEGGKRLEGSVVVHGAKNSALPILTAALLADGESVIHNCPVLTDVDTALEILRSLGCRVRRSGRTVLINPSGGGATMVPDHLMREMRASVLFMGALLAKRGEAEISWPGGCALGPRPIDLHLSALEQLGAKIIQKEERLYCQRGRLEGAKIVLPFPSVGATENAMLAACSARGKTEIHNAAQEPEIVDLQGFLQSMGAEVSGAGSKVVEIIGGALHPGEYSVMADRIVSATCLAGVACAGGEGEILQGDWHTVLPVISALRAAGCDVTGEKDRILIRCQHPVQGIGALATAPHPGFPTDAQPLLVAALAGGVGETRITETIFTGRYRYATQLHRLGAEIRVEGNTAVVVGKGRLSGNTMQAEDLRGGAALTIAALGAQGQSRIDGITHIDRGYEDLAGLLACLGGRISRMNRDE